jgi:starch synthase
MCGTLDAFYRSLAMANDTLDAGVVHCHTWYTDMVGFWGIPVVPTMHSLDLYRSLIPDGSQPVASGA